MSTRPGLGVVADRLAIHELRYRYCTYLDEQRWEPFVGLFTEDVRFDASGVPGMDVIEGIDSFSDFVFDTVAGSFTFSMHQAYHPLIEIDGATGSGNWGLNEVVARPDESVWWRQGSYVDAYRLVDDEWKFSAVGVEIEAETRLDVSLEFPEL